MIGHTSLPVLGPLIATMTYLIVIASVLSTAALLLFLHARLKK